MHACYSSSRIGLQASVVNAKSTSYKDSYQRGHNNRIMHESFSQRVRSSQLEDFEVNIALKSATANMTCESSHGLVIFG